mmetsp:Transcript_3347/g.7309  ORF Transcript_3347/g.7309 Transcript_3347/m.7309 type:complete len:81 (+) Transcript_3347:1234-1476(+)
MDRPYWLCAHDRYHSSCTQQAPSPMLRHACQQLPSTSMFLHTQVQRAACWWAATISVHVLPYRSGTYEGAAFVQRCYLRA